MKSYHLTHKGPRGKAGKWVLQPEKNDDSPMESIEATSKKDALKLAIAFCKKHMPCSLKIHTIYGNRIQEERTFPRSADPRSSKG